MRFAIIGYGTMGAIRHDVIKNMSRHSITKVFEPNIGKTVPSDVQRVENYLDIIHDSNIDGVFICVPNYLILKYVTESLDAGKHVFCEKPPGINSAQVLEMADAEKRNPSLKLMFGFNHRHHESMIHAKEVIDSGKLGNVLWMRGRYGKSVPPDFETNWRSKKKFAGGGIFLDQGIHMLDLFLMMCGNFDEVKAYISNLYWLSDIEDNVFAIFRNKKGQVASLHSTMTQWRHLFALEIFLEKGHIVINGLLTTSGSYGQEQLTISKNTSSWKHGVSWDGSETRTYNINTSWGNEIAVFLDAIENGKPVPMGNSDDAYKIMVLVDKVYAQK
jgi:predicted dehydrogenase